jgi:hypothetical protein
LQSDDPPPGMPGQINTDKEIQKDYTAIRHQALEKMRKLAGEVIMKTGSNGSMTWKVSGSHAPPDVNQKMEHHDYGLKQLQKSEDTCNIFLRPLFKDNYTS